MKKTVCKLLSVMAAAAIPFTFIPTFGASAAEPIKVACVGDSITQGLGNTPYPSRLADLLGDGYDVQNFGLYATTACNNTGRPYTSCEDSPYQSSLDFNPDVVILMLGTNDGNDGNIANAEQHYKTDMTSLINSYLALPSKPTVYLVTCPYAYLPSNASVNTRIVPMQRELAEDLSLPMIDMNKLTENMPQNFQDQLHPSETGYYILAQNIYEQAFDGKVYDVTVKTQPSATVKLSAYEFTVDGNGEAKIRMAAGKRQLSVIASNLEPAFTEIEIKENCIVSCELKQKMNIVLEGTVTTNGDGEPEKAFDGDFSAGWQNSSKTAGVYIGKTFNKNHTFSSVKLYWETGTRPGTDEAAYTIEYFDGANWQAVKNPVYTFDSGEHAVSLDTVSFDSIAASGIRVVINSFTNDKYASSLYEMSAYGADNGEATVTVTADETSETENISSEADADEGSGIPKWLIPVAAAAAVAVVAGCIIWLAVALRTKN